MDLAEYARVSPAHVRVGRPIAKLFASGLLWLFGGLRVTGAYRVPREGGVLILSNHLADIDPIAVQVACPRLIHFMAKSELFDIRVIGRIMRWAGSFPVKRGEPDRSALKLAANLVKEGEVVCVFPEGQLSETGETQELKSGVALIVRLAAEMPVICCGIRNTQKVMPYGSLIPRPSFKKIVVNWGEPRVFGKGASTEEIVEWAAGQFKELTAA